MNNKKSGKLLKIIGAFALIALSLFITGCAETDTFNGKGAAEIRITLAEDYGAELTVQCPNGTVTGSGTEYAVALKTRAMADVILTCEGYETLTLSFTTAEMLSGTVHKTDVQLTKKKSLLTVAVNGVSDAEGLEFTVVSGDTKILNKTVNQRNVTLELEKIADCAIEVSGEGYIPNTLKVYGSSFVNYKSGYKLPLLPAGSEKAVLTLINDLDERNVSYGIVTYPYYYQLENSIVMDNKLINLSNENDYLIGGNAGKLIYLSAEELKTAPYPVHYLSEIYGNDYVSPGNSSGTLELKFSTQINAFENFSVYNAAGTKINGYPQWDGSGNYSYLMNMSGAGSTATFVYAGASSGLSDFTFYEHTITAQDMSTGSITVQVGKVTVPKKEAYINFIDETGEPADFEALAKFQYNSYDSQTNIGNDGIFSAQGFATYEGAGRVKVDYGKILTQYHALGFLYCSAADDNAYQMESGYIDWKTVLASGEAGVNVTLYRMRDVKIRFQKSDLSYEKQFDFGPAATLDAATGYYTFRARQGSYIPLDNGSASLLSEGYTVPSLLFYKELFTYQPADGSYAYDLKIYKEKRITPVFTGAQNLERMEISVSKNGMRIFSNILYYQKEIRQWDEPALNEDMVGAVISFSIWDEKTAAYYESKITFTLEMFEAGMMNVPLVKKEYR